MVRACPPERYLHRRESRRAFHHRQPGGRLTRSFEALTYRGRLRRYRRVASAALARYALKVDSVRLLQHDENITYRVEAGGQSYLLRIHRGGRRSPAQIRSELAWLQALRREAGLAVPEPVPDKGGRVQGEIVVEGVGHRFFVLFRWLPGRFRRTWPTLAPLERAGTLLAKLHLHGASLDLYPGFSRPTWSLEALCDGDVEECSWDDIDAAYRSVHLEARARVLEEGHKLVALASHSLIHGDYHHHNFLFRGVQTGAIDFDECGFGDPTYDLATTLLWFRLWGRGPDARRFFLRGYTLVQALPPAFDAGLDLYTVARMLYMVLWRAGRPGHPLYDYWMEAMVPRSAARLQGWLKGADPFAPK